MALKHVAINASVLGAQPSGLGRYASGLVHGLSGAGLDLVVYTSMPEAVANLPARVHRASQLLRPERGPVGHLARLAWCQIGLRLRVQRDRPTLLLNPLPEGLVLSPVPQVSVIHDLIPLAFPRAFPRQQWYFRRLVPAVLRASRAVVAVSEATRQLAIATYGLDPTLVHTVPNGHDTKFCPEGPSASSGIPYVLYVGNALPHKNLPRLIEAFASIRRTVTARLVVIGAGRARDAMALNDLARRLGAPVENHGFVSDRELIEWYRGARALVLPSLMEGFGLTALEAMACGTPPIVSRIPSLMDLVGEAGIQADPANTAELADAMCRLLTDDGLRKDLRERALERAAEFTWARTAREVEAILRGVNGE
jgi:glycosyltransferase involved in cell wall biosynthesis